MSKKHKTAGKAGSGKNGKKAKSPVKKKSTPARSVPAKKKAKTAGSTKRPAKKSAPKKAAASPKKQAKKGAKPAPKAISRKISRKPATKAKNKRPAKSTITKPAAKPAKKPVLTKKSAKPVQKPIARVKTGKIEPKSGKTVQAAVAASRVQNPAARNGTEKAASTGKHQSDSRKLNDLFTKKPFERKPDDVLAISNTIPIKAKNDISPSKIASISYGITNPVRRNDSYSVRTDKEPPGKFELEFVVHASAEMLYEFLSTPSGLSEWFCDDLNIRNGIYTFIWEDQLQQARLLKTVDQQLVRFQWVDKTDGSYFEFRIQRDDLTNDISLIITDFAETVSERESSKLLWNSQVEKLMHVIGSIF